MVKNIFPYVLHDSWEQRIDITNRLLSKHPRVRAVSDFPVKSTGKRQVLNSPVYSPGDWQVWGSPEHWDWQVGDRCGAHLSIETDRWVTGVELTCATRIGPFPPGCRNWKRTGTTHGEDQSSSWNMFVFAFPPRLTNREDYAKQEEVTGKKGRLPF